MNLHARLWHALGDRLIELPGRPIDDPVVVGRSATADVQVPSIAVAQRHCVLFVHEGRWAVQDLGGTAGTFVNGKKAEGPTLLRVGDVVTLGSDPAAPKIEIDPAAAAKGNRGPATEAGAVAGRTAGAPAPAHTAAPVPPPVVPAPVVSPGAVPVPTWQQPPGYPAVPYGAQPMAPAAQSPEPAAADDVVGWAADVGTTRYHTRGRPRSDYSLPIAIFVTLLIVGGVAYYTREHWQRQHVQVVQPAPAPAAAAQVGPPASAPATVPAEAAAPVPPGMFDRAEAGRAGGATGRAAGRAGAGAAAVTPPPAPAAVVPPERGTPGDDMSADAAGADGAGADAADVSTPRKAAAGSDDPAWKQVESARFSPDEAKAILQFDDYARSHPDRNVAEIQAFTEKALDRIWFERIDQLCRRRDDVKAKLSEADKDLAEETNDAYKKRVLEPLKTEYAKRLASLREELSQTMKYAGEKGPDLVDDEELERLRRQRDPAAYAAWKAQVLAHIRRSHGELPWAGD